MADRRRRGGRTLILVLFILILLGIIAFAALRMLGGNLVGSPNTPTQVANAGPTATPIPQTIVVARGDIKRGQYLTADNLETAQLGDSQLKDGEFYREVKEVVGMRSLYNIKDKTPIKSAMVALEGSGASIPSFEIPAGKVAISVPISRLSSVSYGLQKGDHVNVLASLLMVDLDTNFQTVLPDRTGYVLGPGPMKEDVVTSLTSRGYMGPNYTADAPTAASFFGRIELDPTLNTPMLLVPGEVQRPRLVSQTLLQDVVVLQLGYFEQKANNQQSLSAPSAETTPGAAAPAGQSPVAAPATQPGAQAAAPTTPAGPDVVTLIVDPQEAVTLNYMMLSGANMNLVLRSAGDESRVDTEAVTLQFLLDQYRIPNPAKLPYGTSPRQDTFPTNVSAFPEPGPTPTPAQ